MKKIDEINPRELKLNGKLGKKNNKLLVGLDSNPIIFQTPPVQIIVKKSTTNKDGVKSQNQKELILALELDIDFREWMEIVQERIESKFENFSPFMERELLIKTDSKTMCFTRQKEFLPLSKLEPGDNIICILGTTGTWTDSVSTNLVWKAKQIVRL